MSVLPEVVSPPARLDTAYSPRTRAGSLPVHHLPVTSPTAHASWAPGPSGSGGGYEVGKYEARNIRLSAVRQSGVLALRDRVTQ